MDYSIFYKNKYETLDEFSNLNSWDIFISVYNDSDRVKRVFDSAVSSKKYWLSLPEYEYTDIELLAAGNGTLFYNKSLITESEIITDLFARFNSQELKSKICIDITGFMRPHIIFLVRFLKFLKIKKIDFLYSDPVAYTKAEKTVFTRSEVEEVRQVYQCEGAHNTDTSNDMLIIGCGYDYKLISSVAEEKSNARKVQIFGFPSLQADMYQENLVNAYKAEEEIGGKAFLDDHNTLYAPANDPFITANVISNFVYKENRKKNITNLYLSPLSTKAQTLGFSIYYVWECINKPVSIIFPFCEKYTRETTEGIKKIWKYTVEIP